MLVLKGNSNMLKTLTNNPPPRSHYRVVTRIGMRADIDYFIENLAMMVVSGLGISSALESIKTEVRSRRMKRALTQLIADVEDGVPLAIGLEKLNLFPSHVTSLVRIGEASGKLSQNLKVVARQQEKDRMFQSKIKSAMMYPVFVLVLTLVVGIGIAWFILPKLATVFSQLHLKLPLITKVLIATGIFFNESGAVAVPFALAVLAIVLYILFGFSKTRWIGQGIVLHTPGAGALIKESEVARFGYLLSSLLEAGLPVVPALTAVRDAADFPSYRKFYAYLCGSVADGNSFQKSFVAYPKSRAYLPMPVQQLIVSGEQSGTLPQVLQKVSDQYEEKTDTTAKNLSVILEPILLVIVWLGVVMVALAVILPIYSLVGGLGNQIDNPSSSAVASTEQDQETIPVVESSIASSTLPILPQLTILGSGLGYVNVRSGASAAADVISKVYPDEMYSYKDQSDGWYEIALTATSTGWVYGKYVSREENDIQ